MGRGCRAQQQNHAYTRAVSIVILLVAGLFGCSSVERPDGAPSGRIDLDSIPDAVPKVEPRSRYGNPPSYQVRGKRYYTLGSGHGYRKRGVASWYGDKFHGQLTSNREPYDMYAMTAAHCTLPLPTYARVTNLQNGRSVVVRINDRGPFHDNRLIDLSYVAAAKLDIVRHGTGLVEVAAIDPRAPAIRPAPRPVPQAPSQAAPKVRPQPVVTPATPRLYLQIGAFSSRFNAERLQARIASRLPEAVQIDRLESDPYPLYRVRIGPLDSVELADNLSNELYQEMGLSDTKVVVE